jgi:Tol biopolymer transport system component
MDLNGEHARRLFEADENSSYQAVQWSPDGKRIAYMRFRQTPTEWEQFVENRDLHGGPVITMLSSGPWWQNGGLRDYFWLPAGRLIYVTGDNDINGYSCNYWELRVDERTDEPRGKPRQLTNWAGFCMQEMTPTMSGKQIAFLRAS